MHHFAPKAWLLVASLMPLHAQAYVVQRCEAPDGALTFTDQSCGEHDTQSFQQAYNPPLGNSHNMMPSRERLPTGHRSRLQGGPRVVVIEESNDRSAFRETGVAAEPGTQKRKGAAARRFTTSE